MALTATATNNTRASVIKSLSMQKQTVISVPPMKNNIIYAVAEKSSVNRAFIPLAEGLREKRTNMGRTLIFCRRYEEMTSIYLFFKQTLGTDFTEPPGAPDLARFRLVDMFSHCTHDSVKNTIIQQFTTQSPLRIVIATTAFGMGIDCPDVRQVFHWGVPDDAEACVQESGRAGRDKQPSCALLVYGRKYLRQTYVSEHMRRYCQNEDECRKKILFEDFEGCENIKFNGCMCCDVCKKQCMCGKCDRNMSVFYFNIGI